MDGKPASHSACQLVRWMGALDANTAGNVHGGVVMRVCDEAAALAAIKHSRQRVVTAAMDRMAFLYPIFVGDVVVLSATVNAAWRTSMEVGVRVEVENVMTGERRHTSSCYFVMVALDDGGTPSPAPPLIAETAAQKRRMAQANSGAFLCRSSQPARCSSALVFVPSPFLYSIAPRCLTIDSSVCG